MEAFINSIDFLTATQETASKVFAEMEKMRRADQIKSSDLTKCLQALQAKVAVPDYLSELQEGYYVASHIMQEICNEMK